MSKNNLVYITKISQKNDRHFEICWNDDSSSVFDIVYLRKKCPCAVCIDEHTGEKILKEEMISENIRPKRVFSVGRYALGIEFDDGHSTGIYTYQYLKKLTQM